MENYYQRAKRALKRTAMVGLAALALNGCATTNFPKAPAGSNPDYLLIYNEANRIFSATCEDDSSDVIVTSPVNLLKAKKMQSYEDTMAAYLDMKKDRKLDAVSYAEESWWNFGDSITGGKLLRSVIITDDWAKFNPSYFSNYLDTGNVLVILRKSKMARKLQIKFDSLEKSCKK